MTDTKQETEADTGAAVQDVNSDGPDGSTGAGTDVSTTNYAGTEDATTTGGTGSTGNAENFLGGGVGRGPGNGK